MKSPGVDHHKVTHSAPIEYLPAPYIIPPAAFADDQNHIGCVPFQEYSQNYCKNLGITQVSNPPITQALTNKLPSVLRRSSPGGIGPQSQWPNCHRHYQHGCQAPAGAWCNIPHKAPISPNTPYWSRHQTQCQIPCQPKILYKTPCQPQDLRQSPCQPIAPCQPPCQRQAPCQPPCQPQAPCQPPCPSQAPSKIPCQPQAPCRPSCQPRDQCQIPCQPKEPCQIPCQSREPCQTPYQPQAPSQPRCQPRCPSSLPRSDAPKEYIPHNDDVKSPKAPGLFPSKPPSSDFPEKDIPHNKDQKPLKAPDPFPSKPPCSKCPKEKLEKTPHSANPILPRVPASVLPKSPPRWPPPMQMVMHTPKLIPISLLLNKFRTKPPDPPIESSLKPLQDISRVMSKSNLIPPPEYKNSPPDVPQKPKTCPPQCPPKCQPPCSEYPPHQCLRCDPSCCLSNAVSRYQCLLPSTCCSYGCPGLKSSCPFQMEGRLPRCCENNRCCGRSTSIPYKCHCPNHRCAYNRGCSCSTVSPIRGMYLTSCTPMVSSGRMYTTPMNDTYPLKVRKTPSPRSRGRSSQNQTESRSFPGSHRSQRRKHPNKPRKNKKSVKSSSTKHNGKFQWPFPRSVPDCSTVSVSKGPDKETKDKKTNRSHKQHTRTPPGHQTLTESSTMCSPDHRHKGHSNLGFRCCNQLGGHDHSIASARRRLYLSHTTDDEVVGSSYTQRDNVIHEERDLSYSEDSPNSKHDERKIETDTKKGMDNSEIESSPCLSNYKHTPSAKVTPCVNAEEKESDSLPAYLSSTGDDDDYDHIDKHVTFLQKYSSNTKSFYRDVVMPTIRRYLRLS